MRPPLWQHQPFAPPAYAGWLIATVTFCCVFPTLGWLEFSNGIEQLHASTVLETRREGHYLLPTLNGVLRTQKPPLPAWVTAPAISDQTLRQVASPDAAERSAGYKRLSWQIRWPGLLACCLMLVSAFDLARTLATRRLAFWSTVIAASSALFLRYGRLASTDVQLALWVVTSNALIARVLLRGQPVALPFCGATLGLAVMCKGPVALLMTVVPAVVWAAVCRNGNRAVVPPNPNQGNAQNGFKRRPRLVHWLLALAAFLAVSLPWPVMVLLSSNDAWQIWRREIFREDATQKEYGPPWLYLSLFHNLTPWTAVLILGIATSFRRRTVAPSATSHGHAGGQPVSGWRRRVLGWVRGQRRSLYTWLLLLLPLAVMSVVRDKADRYLLPLLPIVAIIAARGLLAAFAGLRRGRRNATVWLVVQVVVVAALAVILPVAGLIPGVLKTIDGLPWFGGAVGVSFLLTGLLLAVALLWLARRRLPEAVLAATLAMFLLNAALLWGYKDSRDGRCELRPLIEQIWAYEPGATVSYYALKGDTKAEPPDLGLYLDRVVRPWQQMRRLGTAEQADLLIMLQRENEAPPAVPGWHIVLTMPKGERFWHALAPGEGALRSPPADDRD